MLERQRTGEPIERLALTPYFAGSELPTPVGHVVAVLSRWNSDPSDVGHEPSSAAIRARPAVLILRLRDYDHDGIAGQFLLQVSVAPCRKQVDVAVGVTRGNPGCTSWLPRSTRRVLWCSTDCNGTHWLAIRIPSSSQIGPAAITAPNKNPACS